MSDYRSKIKALLPIITHGIKKLPEDRQGIIANRVKAVIDKYSSKDRDEEMPKFYNELSFNLNFMKMANPHIDFSEPSKTESNSESDNNQNESEAVEMQGEFEVENSSQLLKNMKNIGEVREEVKFSNWTGDNIDPDNLKRHKQLLTRQHFAGEQWEGVEKPKLQVGQLLSQFMANNDPNDLPKVQQKDLEFKKKKFQKNPDEMFEKVKR